MARRSCAVGDGQGKLLNTILAEYGYRISSRPQTARVQAMCMVEHRTAKWNTAAIRIMRSLWLASAGSARGPIGMNRGFSEDTSGITGMSDVGMNS
ncbi:MAG: hypothetical protein FWD57_11160 [Polyangiaceae bacterium]|nr:hypothetical protein [Polyangiaceae bacterium]